MLLLHRLLHASCIPARVLMTCDCCFCLTQIDPFRANATRASGPFLAFQPLDVNITASLTVLSFDGCVCLV